MPTRRLWHVWLQKDGLLQSRQLCVTIDSFNRVRSTGMKTDQCSCMQDERSASSADLPSLTPPLQLMSCSLRGEAWHCGCHNNDRPKYAMAGTRINRAKAATTEPNQLLPTSHDRATCANPCRLASTSISQSETIDSHPSIYCR